MPELPDVELVARRLRRSIAGRRVTRVEIRDRSVVRSPAPRLFARRLRGRRIRTVGRRGKYLLVYLDAGLVIVGHLRMTGDFVVVPRHEPLRPHTRLVLGLGPSDLRFVDQRRFGHVDVIDARELETFPGLRALGVEPLAPAFSFDHLRALIDDRRGALKGFLLRQDLIAGIGNIYADEILFRARLHPARPLRSLRPAQVRALHRSIRAALRRGIAALSRRGRPIGRRPRRRPEVLRRRDRRTRGGRRSSVREGDLVAVREKGGACPRCGGPLRIAVIAGRTTYFCPRCQR